MVKGIVVVAFAILSLVTVGFSSQNAFAGNGFCNTITLEDGNSEVGIFPCSTEGVFEWLIAQNLGTTQNPFQVTPNQLDTQWFYIKINDDCDGDCPVFSIDDFFGNPSDVEFNNGNEVTIEYVAEGLSLDVTYTLTGGDIEFGSATLSEVIEITNVNEGDVSFTLYQYSDFDLFGLVGAASDIASFDEESSTVTQTDRARVSETVVSPEPTHWEIDNAGDLLTNIEDGEDLADSDTIDGDIAWAFQWDFDLQDGESVTIEKEKSIDQSTPTELHCELSGESSDFNVNGMTEIQFDVEGTCLAFVESGEELITFIADGSTAWVTIDEVGEDLFDVTVVYELRGIFGGNPLIVKTFSQMTSDELFDELIDMGIFDDGPGPIPLEVIAGDGAFEGLGGFGTSDFSLEPEFFFQSLLWIVFEDLQIGEGTPYVSMGEFNTMPEHGSVALADFDSGQLFQLGDQIVSSSLSGIAFDEQGRLYVSSIEDEGSRLYEIDPMNGEIIAGGSQFFLDDDEQDFFGNGQINDLAYDGINDVLVGIGEVIEGATIGIPGDALFSIDTGTGELTVIGDLDDNLQPFGGESGEIGQFGGIAFANDGTLLISGVTEGSNNFVAEVDITNVVEGDIQFDIPGGIHEVDIFLDGLGVRQSDGQIFGTNSGIDSVHSVDLETGETPTVAGEGTDPDDIAFFPSAPLTVGGGGEGYEGPTLGEFDNGRLIVSDGFCFDQFCMDVTDYFNHLPIRQVDSGSTHTISMTAYCPSGSNRCNYASVGAAPPGTDINSVDWNVMLKRTGNSNDWQVTKVDPNGMLGDVTGTVQVVDASRIQYTFNIEFITPASIGTVDGNAEPPEDNMILVTEIRDSNGGVGRNIFNEGVFVNDIYAYPQVDASYLPSVKVAPLCLNEDSTDRNTCAFELVRQWAIKQAEEKLKEIYEQNNYKTD